MYLAASPQSSMVATCNIVKMEAKKRPNRAPSLYAQLQRNDRLHV